MVPRVFVVGSLLIGFPMFVVHLCAGIAFQISPRLLATIDMYTSGAMLLHWNVVLGAGIAAFIVMVMKGPAYVADAYSLDDGEP